MPKTANFAISTVVKDSARRETEVFRPRVTRPTDAKVVWAQSLVLPHHGTAPVAEWHVECALTGARLLRDCLDVDPHRRGGVPVLKGTGFTLAQTLVELSDSSGVDEVADNFDLDSETIRKALHGLSLLLEKPYDR